MQGEYFRLITEKISKIRNNLKDKLSKRLEQGKSLVQKMKILRQAFQALQPQLGYCPIEVSREEIFEVGLILVFQHQVVSIVSNPMPSIAP